MKKSYISRMTLDWEQLPVSDHQTEKNHPFAYEFDILGEFSLLRLLNTSSSKGGSDRLAAWLLSNEPNQAEIEQRQSLVDELEGMSRFRNHLSLVAKLSKGSETTRHEGTWISEWIERTHPTYSLQISLIASLILAPLTLILILLAIFHSIPQLWIISFSLYILLFVLVQPRLAPMFHESTSLEKSLRKFRNVFTHFEQSSYRDAPNLELLCHAFTKPSHKPSEAMKRIQRVTTGASFRTNTLLWLLLNLVMPWDLYFAYRLEQIKKRLEDDLPNWLDAWFEIEALCSLATFAYLNPHSSRPQIKPGTDSPILYVEGLGHPLIPYESRIPNDFKIKAIGDLAIITGSNMSGKSTFLRTLGINLVLANAGGHVIATSFEYNLFRLFASIGVSDSITDGISFFYAEVKRLKSLLDELQLDRETPILYCIDEIFKGTNNKERLIGSREILKELILHRGVGLIATHDLELVHLAEEFDQISNFHFREEIKKGKMIFDYILQQGPCPTTNALKIMELEGLPVNAELSEGKEAGG